MTKTLECSHTAGFDPRGGGAVSSFRQWFSGFLREKLLSPLPLRGRARERGQHVAFTLAEVLITLGIIGVVAAITIPILVINIQERVQKEQVRTVKYKLTQATDTMKSLDKIGPYASTKAFLNELKQHFKIAKICDNSHLRECWTTDTISTPDGDVSVSNITNGTALKALSLGTASTTTMGIVTGDGTPMILVYSPVCTPLNPLQTYSWSMIDNKPETNATTNCISAIFDINGTKKPNRLGADVRTLNSIFGYKIFGATSMSKSDCEAKKDKLGINGCSYATDYWAGAVDKCASIGLHLPSMQTLANIAGAKYGRSDIGATTRIWTGQNGEGGCLQLKQAWWCGSNESCKANITLDANDICVTESGNLDDTNSAVKSINGGFWSSSEVSASVAQKRYMYSSHSYWYSDIRSNYYVPLCVGD